jgi:hypothetical protein
VASNCPRRDKRRGCARPAREVARGDRARSPRAPGTAGRSRP